jgi:hypothetical protein
MPSGWSVIRSSVSARSPVFLLFPLSRARRVSSYPTRPRAKATRCPPPRWRGPARPRGIRLVCCVFRRIAHDGHCPSCIPPPTPGGSVPVDVIRPCRRLWVGSNGGLVVPRSRYTTMTGERVRFSRMPARICCRAQRFIPTVCSDPSGHLRETIDSGIIRIAPRVTTSHAEHGRPRRWPERGRRSMVARRRVWGPSRVANSVYAKDVATHFASPTIWRAHAEHQYDA